MEVEAARCECCGFTEECTPEYITAVRAEYLGRWVCGLCAAAVGDEVRRAGVDGQRGGGEAGQDAAGPRLSLRDAAEGGGQAGEAGADQRGELVGRRLQVGDGRGGAAKEEQGGLGVEEKKFFFFFFLPFRSSWRERVVFSGSKRSGPVFRVRD
ncbi:hypothetical protein ZWY2020_032518 [Hordeum vulgare]|nr:hypothetical protein ZWY2020_032518 [Hordeum vulgare]